jgi:polyisoprenoid-binding protein YceI
MKKNLFLIALSVVAIGLEALAGNNTQENMSVDTDESKVVWLGKKVTGEHSGEIKIANGDLQFDGEMLTGGSFMIDMNSMTNTDIKSTEGQQKLLGHLMSDDFFGVEKFPTSTFKITDVEHKKAGKYHVKGDLTIKGITKTIEFPAQVTMLDGKASATASITVDRSEFDVKYGSGSFFDGLGDKMIYDDFTLDVTLIVSK